MCLEGDGGILPYLVEALLWNLQRKREGSRRGIYSRQGI